MKRIALALATVAFMASCKNDKQEEPVARKMNRKHWHL